MPGHFTHFCRFILKKTNNGYMIFLCYARSHGKMCFISAFATETTTTIIIIINYCNRNIPNSNISSWVRDWSGRCLLCFQHYRQYFIRPLECLRKQNTHLHWPDRKTLILFVRPVHWMYSRTRRTQRIREYVS